MADTTQDAIALLKADHRKVEELFEQFEKARGDGRKELIALTDGYREATESWADLLRDCARRGMRAPVLAIGDGALGFWGALREVFPETSEQRCWFHKISNVLAALPKSAHPGAKKVLSEIWNAEDKRHAHDAVKAFERAALLAPNNARYQSDLGTAHLAENRLDRAMPALLSFSAISARLQGSAI